jgi:hypothetical protein
LTSFIGSSTPADALVWFRASIDLVEAIAWPAVAAFALWGLRDLRKPLVRTLRNRALKAIRGPRGLGLEFGAVDVDGDGRWLGYEAGALEITQQDVNESRPPAERPPGGGAP